MGTRLRVGASGPWLATALLLSVGCTADVDSPQSVVSVTDSAGIEIVEHPASQYAEVTAVPITTLDAVSIGAVDGPPEELLYRVGTVKWIDEESIIIANARTEVRVYSQEGDFLRSFGRAGDGPGEFASIVGALPTDDGNVLVVDGQRRNFALFDTTGGLLNSVQSGAGVPRSPDLVSSMVLAGKVTPVVFANGPQIDRRTDTIVTVSAESGGRLAAVPLRGAYVWWALDQGSGMTIPLGRTLSPASYVSARAGHVVAGTSDEYELRVYDEGLGLRRIIRVSRPRTLVGPELRAYYSKRFEEGGVPGHMRPPLMDSVPHFIDIEVDQVGRIWVRIEHGGDAPDLLWDVFSPDGRSLKRVQLPDGLEFRDANRTSWVGLRTDDLGVEYLRIGSFSDSLWKAP